MTKVYSTKKQFTMLRYLYRFRHKVKISKCFFVALTAARLHPLADNNNHLRTDRVSKAHVVAPILLETKS